MPAVAIDAECGLPGNGDESAVILFPVRTMVAKFSVVVGAGPTYATETVSSAPEYLRVVPRLPASIGWTSLDPCPAPPPNPLETRCVRPQLFLGRIIMHAGWHASRWASWSSKSVAGSAKLAAVGSTPMPSRYVAPRPVENDAPAAYVIRLTERSHPKLFGLKSIPDCPRRGRLRPNRSTIRLRDHADRIHRQALRARMTSLNGGQETYPYATLSWGCGAAGVMQRAGTLGAGTLAIQGRKAVRPQGMRGSCRIAENGRPMAFRAAKKRDCLHGLGPCPHAVLRYVMARAKGCGQAFAPAWVRRDGKHGHGCAHCETVVFLPPAQEQGMRTRERLTAQHENEQ